MNRLQRTLKKAEKELNIDIRDITRQAMIFAIQSAAKATGPTTRTSPSELPNRYKFRKIVRYTGPGNYYRYYDRSGQKQVLFTRKELDVKAARKRGKMRNIRKLTRAIEVFDRKSRRIVQRIYHFNARGSYDRVNNIGKIPYYGLAKAGWLRCLSLLPPPSPEWRDAQSEATKAKFNREYRKYVPLPGVKEIKSFGRYGLIVVNNVRYVSIVGPNATADALRKTANRMNKIVQYKLDQKYGKMNL